jgi:micrococcal nuclease
MGSARRGDAGRGLRLRGFFLLLLLLILAVAGCDSPSETLDPDELRRGSVPAEAERAEVVRYVDGDTVRLVGTPRSRWLAPGESTSVRLLEIDTPELRPETSRPECFAAEADEALRAILDGEEPVWVTRDEELLDRYGRTLLYLWTPDGVFVNEEMVRLGYARAVLYAPNDAHIGRIRTAEAEAREHGRGLWGAC